MKAVRVIAARTSALVSPVFGSQPYRRIDRHIATQPTRSLDGAAAPVEPHPIEGAALVLAFSRKSNRRIQGSTLRLKTALSLRPQQLRGNLQWEYDLGPDGDRRWRGRKTTNTNETTVTRF